MSNKFYLPDMSRSFSLQPEGYCDAPEEECLPEEYEDLFDEEDGVCDPMYSPGE